MFQDDSSRGRAPRLRIAALVAALLAAGGCARHAAGPASATPAPSTEEDRLVRAELEDQRSAQKAWCTYLEALYLRSAAGAKAWPRFAQCAAAETVAAPEMLRRTADCSKRALDRFAGDPFTPEYAELVGRCGNDALSSLAATDREVAPYVATICGRANVCGGIDVDECRQQLGAGLGPHLERAVGAMNRRGRARLRACLRTAACSDLGSQVSTCLEPIMDDLLWLPG